MSALERLRETAAPDTKALLALAKKAQAEMGKVQKARDALVAITSQMPAEFAKIRPAKVHNLDTPDAYQLYGSYREYEVDVPTERSYSGRH